MELSPKLLVFIVLVIIMFLCSFVLQGLLSKKDNPWIGVILPIISFLLATFLGLGRLVIHRKLSLDILLKDFLLFSAFNLATVIYLIIFFVRLKIKTPCDDDKSTAKND